MKVASVTFAILIVAFIVSLTICLKVKSEDESNLKNSAKGLVFGAGVLILICSVWFIEIARSYTGRCYQLWDDDLGTPCSRLEHFGGQADFGFALMLSVSWPFIVLFLGACVLAALGWNKAFRKQEN